MELGQKIGFEFHWLKRLSQKLLWGKSGGNGRPVGPQDCWVVSNVYVFENRVLDSIWVLQKKKRKRSKDLFSNSKPQIAKRFGFYRKKSTRNIENCSCPSIRFFVLFESTFLTPETEVKIGGILFVERCVKLRAVNVQIKIRKRGRWLTDWKRCTIFLWWHSTPKISTISYEN